FFSSRRRHTRSKRDWSSDVCSSDLLSLTVLIACQSRQASNENTRQLTREDFNRRAAEKFLPLFWREDTNRDDKIQPNELAVLWRSEERRVGKECRCCGLRYR